MYRIQHCDGVKETIIFENSAYRFLITTHEQSTEGKYVFFQKVLSNPLASGWKYFQTEKEAFEFGEDFTKKFLASEEN